MRSSARKQAHNRAIKSRLKTLERNYEAALQAAKKDEAAQLLRQVASAYDKAAKSGVVHKAQASRKRSRLAARLAALK